MSVYLKDVWTRLPELMAQRTFGSILKINSTKKVVQKLQGKAAGSASWATRRERLWCLSWQMQRASSHWGEWQRDSGQPIPKILYTDRNCTGIANPKPTAIKRSLTKKDLLNHCKRRTRGTDAMIANIESLPLFCHWCARCATVQGRDHNHLGRTGAPRSVPARSNRHPTLYTDWSHPERPCSPAHLQMCQGKHLTRELPLASSKVNLNCTKLHIHVQCTVLLVTSFIHVGLYQALQQVMFIVRLIWLMASQDGTRTGL